MLIFKGAKFFAFWAGLPSPVATHDQLYSKFTGVKKILLQLVFWVLIPQFYFFVNLYSSCIYIVHTCLLF